VKCFKPFLVVAGGLCAFSAAATPVSLRFNDDASFDAYAQSIGLNPVGDVLIRRGDAMASGDIFEAAITAGSQTLAPSGIDWEVGLNSLQPSAQPLLSYAPDTLSYDFEVVPGLVPPPTPVSGTASDPVLAGPVNTVAFRLQTGPSIATTTASSGIALFNVEILVGGDTIVLADLFDDLLVGSALFGDLDAEYFVLRSDSFASGFDINFTSGLFDFFAPSGVDSPSIEIALGFSASDVPVPSTAALALVGIAALRCGRIRVRRS